ncbi:MAG TPA: T9SS type A sorting domain-containing protein [Saprospiraceae bacterium]|nr:T9SS type A sorting domain-containing protein [Saprospiraceae bacterium]
MKYALLFIFTSAFSSILYGQHFTDEGNTWYMTVVNWELNTALEFQVKIGEDTLINNLSYHTVIRNDELIPNWYQLNYFLREDDDKRVFILDSTGHEGILYDFGLESGEQVELWNGFTVTIRSIDSVQVANNQMQSRLKIIARMGQTGEECSAGAEWIDGIGNVGPIPYQYCNNTLNISYGIGCFFRENTALYYPAESSWCESFVTATNQINQTGIDVFPNPVNDFLSIRFDDRITNPKDIQLFNIEGQLIYQNKTMESLHEIDMSQMAFGTYILRVVSADRNLVIKKIVKQ